MINDDLLQKLLIECDKVDAATIIYIVKKVNKITGGSK